MQGQTESVNGVRDSVSSLEARMDRRFEGIDRRLDAIDDKLSRQFLWLVGIQVTTLATIVVVVLAVVIAR